MAIQRWKQLAIVFALLTFGAVVITTVQWLQAFLTFFGHDLSHFLGLVVLLVASGGVAWLILKVSLTASRRETGWVHSITGPNGRWLMLILLVIWGVAMAVLASSGMTSLQGGAWAFIGLLAGTFLFMGFIWAVIGE